MNQKQTIQSDWIPSYLHEVKVNGRVLKRGMLITPHRRPGLPGGKWVFCYAEYLGDTLVLHIEGPIAREARHRAIREADVKAVHTKMRRR